VQVGRGGDDHPVDPGRQHRFGAGGDARAEPFGDLFGQRRRRVADDQFLDGGQASQGLGVKRADPAEADDS